MRDCHVLGRHRYAAVMRAAIGTRLAFIQLGADARGCVPRGVRSRARENRQEGMSPLHCVSAAEVLEALLDAKADINARDSVSPVPPRGLCLPSSSIRLAEQTHLVCLGRSLHFVSVAACE